MSQKPRPKIDKLRNNVKGEKGYRWDLGNQAFDNPGKRYKIAGIEIVSDSNIPIDEIHIKY